MRAAALVLQLKSAHWLEALRIYNEAPAALLRIHNKDQTRGVNFDELMVMSPSKSAELPCPNLLNSGRFAAMLGLHLSAYG